MKSITTTIGALASAEASLLKILAVKFDQEGGAKVRYHVVKLAKLVGAETKHFYDERNALVERYGAGEPKSVASSSPNWSAFLAKVTELTDVQVSIPWGPLTDAMVQPYPEIVSLDLVGLGPLFELDAETDAATVAKL